MMVVRIGMMALSVGVLAILLGAGCNKSVSTLQPVVQPSAKVEREKMTKPSSDRELNRQIELYMLGSSDAYYWRCMGDELAAEEWGGLAKDDSWWRHKTAVGLVAGAYIERVGEAAVPAVVQAWEQAAPGGDGDDEKKTLHNLLKRLGPAGWKAIESPPISPIVGEHPHAPLSDDDSEWVKFFRKEGEGWCDELLWMLARDRNP